MKFNIIGAGRLGQNLALALVTHTQSELVAVCNSNKDSACSAIAAIGKGRAVMLEQLPPADITFITTRDDVISDVVKVLVARNLLLPGSSVVHCSGVLASDLLLPLKNQGCFVASAHPLKAFCLNPLEANEFIGCDCVLEGDEQALIILKQLFAKMGAQTHEIVPLKKATYHAAAVMASNYMVTLAACAADLLHESGFSKNKAKQLTLQLMQSNIKNMQHSASVSDALTGPLMRGDHQTLEKHLQAINNSTTHALYCSAGLATLPITTLTSQTHQVISTLLTKS